MSVDLFMKKHGLHETRIPCGNPENLDLLPLSKILEIHRYYVLLGDRFGSEESQENHEYLVKKLDELICYKREYVEQIDNEISDAFYKSNKKWIEESQLYIDWCDNQLSKNHSPDMAARIIERAFKIYKPC